MDVYIILVGTIIEYLSSFSVELKINYYNVIRGKSLSILYGINSHKASVLRFIFVERKPAIVAPSKS